MFRRLLARRHCLPGPRALLAKTRLTRAPCGPLARQCHLAPDGARSREAAVHPAGLCGMCSYEAAFPLPAPRPPHPKLLRICAVKSSPSAAIIISLNRTILTNLCLKLELEKPVGEGRGAERREGERGQQALGSHRGGLKFPLSAPKGGTEKGSWDSEGEVVLSFPRS